MLNNKGERELAYIVKVLETKDIEGFVFYSQDGQQNFKCVSPKFLLKYHR